MTKGVSWPKGQGPFNLNRAECCAWVADRLTAQLIELHGAKVRSPGQIAEVKRRALELLEASIRHQYPPPAGLAELFKLSMAIGTPRTARGDLFIEAARVKAETGKTGRTLTRELASRGHRDARHTTVVTWERTDDFRLYVQFFTGQEDLLINPDAD
ncbi:MULTISPECIES: hypothetical protein [unclassified Mesorhizobium]|uniref:hypothetical protein n=1 Tax=unclassified Mesorhizobium TaxID=325217 RepID=UPI0033351751